MTGFIGVYRDEEALSGGAPAIGSAAGNSHWSDQMDRMKATMPWQAKIGAKLVLARLPVSYDVWGRIGLFKHGSMVDPDYAQGVFDTHAVGCAAIGRDEGFPAWSWARATR